MNNCPYHDYGKSADKALGAYCTSKKKLVEPEDCEGCMTHKIETSHREEEQRFIERNIARE